MFEYMFDSLSKHPPSDSVKRFTDPQPIGHQRAGTMQSKGRGWPMNTEQADKLTTGTGFVAALDQSGGSTPKALKLYGIAEDAYSGDEEMFDLVHQMRTRIITSPSFDGDRILAAILFEMTMDRDIEGRPTADYLWNVKRVVPILKVDKGLAAEEDGAQVMKPISGLDDLLARAVDKGIFGTKMRSVIKLPGGGLEAVVDQQFEVARQILAAGLVPIIEPEIDIHSPQKGEAEDQLKAAIVNHLGTLGDDQQVMLKLTLPDTDDLYRDLVDHLKVMRVLALSGGYTRAEACERLARNRGVIASFSRALTEGLTVQQSDAEFDKTLDEAIAEIAAASRT
jgi:fructose-bisphosphate aldolase, class I